MVISVHNINKINDDPDLDVLKKLPKVKSLPRLLTLDDLFLALLHFS